ncbi:aminotransferase class V-fold PLP-dependent enzyme [Nocardioides convexus]|uniref:pyridoxal phosphate-dependent decarboxylase family protein n=1 Tax=Nocardioides convexus TaxID=2712224 RepID=UPI002418AA97|nr:aminotransferase class V-fold PLP-dependent enzyme [Nocardioides convexus]
MTPDEIRARLAALQADDLPVHGGRTLAYVYDGGLAEVDALAREAVAAFAGSNGLDPTAFPSLLTMENDLVGFARDLLDGPETMVGTLTSGGTESCLLAVQGARDAHPGVERPNIVVADTVHAAFHKAAHYFGVEARVVPAGPGHRADAAAMAAAIDASTVLVVASAPSYAHGVVDPVTEIAAAAGERGVRCHVDACIGGWVLPYAARLGRAVSPWTFAVEGVTSISTDLHKYAYAPKGASLLLHRTPEPAPPAVLRARRLARLHDAQRHPPVHPLRRPRRGRLGDRAGDRGRRLPRPGPACAGGDRRDRRRHRRPGRAEPGRAARLDARRGDRGRRSRRVHGLRRDGGPRLVRPAAGSPTTTSRPRCTWRSAPRPTRWASSPRSASPSPWPAPPARCRSTRASPTCCAPSTRRAWAMRSSTCCWPPAGSPAMAAELGLPERMAPVNALLDVAPPRLREAVLVAFLDRLARPAPASIAGDL